VTDTPPDIARWIRESRTSAGLTQSQLGERLECGKANVSSWEHGRHRPSPEQMKAIALATHRPLSEVNALLGLTAGAVPGLSKTTFSIRESTERVTRMGDRSGPSFDVAHPASQSAAHTRLSIPRQSSVKVVGHARLTSGGFVILDLDDRLGSVPFPARSTHAYAIRQEGDALDPYARDGDLIVIDPDHPVAPGDNVVVTKIDGGILVARLRYQRGGRLFLDAIVPGAAAPEPLPDLDVASVHYAAGSVPANYLTLPDA